MISSQAKKTLTCATAVAAIASLAAPGNLVAATCTMPNCVTYTAKGQFSSTVVSGNDTFKLAGQTFNIKINDVPESATPSKRGRSYAEYNKLNMTGTVNSGLDPTPVTLSSNAAKIELARSDSTMEDTFTLHVPVQVLGLTFQIKATITGPIGTIPSLKPAPFANPVTLGTMNTTVTYSYTPSGGTLQSTTLTIESGALSTKVVTSMSQSRGSR